MNNSNIIIMNRYIYILSLLFVFLTLSCTKSQEHNNSSQQQIFSLSERDKILYDKTLSEVENFEAQIKKIEDGILVGNIAEIYQNIRKIKYSYNSELLNDTTKKYCDSLKNRINALKIKAKELGSHKTSTNDNIISFSDIPRDKPLLLNDIKTYPIYLVAGERLLYKFNAQNSVAIKIYDANLGKVIRSHKATQISDSIKINYSSIYLIEINPVNPQYITTNISIALTEKSPSARPNVFTKEVACQKGEFGAKAVPGIDMRKCFEEPRKFTLRGQLKAAFSGSAKALVAVQVPTGATDILYSMRIATSEQDRSSDGEFHDNLTRSYTNIKFMGLPIYEKSSSNGLLNTILDDNRPLRDEDAYCNMYVFRNKTQAKQFQDGSQPVSNLSYDVDYSTLGTQSCNGRIPVKGLKTIYLGFENERVRYSNYLWVEVEAIVPNTVYYRIKYSIDN